MITILTDIKQELIRVPVLYLNKALHSGDNYKETWIQKINEVVLLLSKLRYVWCRPRS